MNELPTQQLAATRRRELAKQMADAYLSGVTQEEIGFRHNKSQGFVSAILKEAGVQRKPGKAKSAAKEMA